MAVAISLSFALFACKDKDANQTTDETETMETPADNTQTAEPTPPPVADTVPGVESGIGDEQIP